MPRVPTRSTSRFETRSPRRRSRWPRRSPSYARRGASPLGEEARLSRSKWCALAWVLAIATQSDAVAADKARADQMYRAGVESMKSEAWEEAADQSRGVHRADAERET